jgi:hypothetical protein
LSSTPTPLERQRDTHDAAAARSMVGLTQFINRLQRRARVRLTSLRRLLDALESGSMKLLLNGRDVTQEEVGKLKPDIEYLESVLARIRSSGKSHA